jgi:N-acyl homoserine lactone hydrolase
MKRLGVFTALFAVLLVSSAATVSAQKLYWTASGMFGPFNIQGLIPTYPEAREVKMPVNMWIIDHPKGLLLFDTGMGSHPAVDARYRPVRRTLRDALRGAGAHLDDIQAVVNSHLHFDHCGGNPLLAGRPIHVQSSELEAALATERYTLPALVDFPGATYELMDGESALADGVTVVPTPGHTRGHQAMVVRCRDGTVVVAGQSHDHASAFGADHLAWHARRAGAAEPIPAAPSWMDRLMAFDPRRVVFAHDLSVWEPSDAVAPR